MSTLETAQLAAEELFAQYQKLNSFEQSLLQFLSVVYEPAHTTLIVNCLRKMELNGPRGNRPTAANLNHYIGKFQKAGFVTKEKQCSPHIVEILSKIAVKEGTFNTFAKTIRDEAPVSYYYGKWSTRCWRAIREMRIGIYTQQFDLLHDAEEFITTQCKELIYSLPPTVQILAAPFDRDWFRSLPSSFQFYLLNQLFSYSQSELVSFQKIIAYVENDDEFEGLTIDEILPFKRLLFNHLLLQGELKQAGKILDSFEEVFQGTGAQGSILLLQGKAEEAMGSFEEDMAFLQKINKSEEVAFFGPTGLFYIICMIQLAEKEQYPEIANKISLALSLFGSSRESEAYTYLGTVINTLINDEMAHEEIGFLEDKQPDSLTVLFAALSQYWLTSAVQPDTLELVERLFTNATNNDFHFFALLFADLKAKTNIDKEENEQLVASIQQETGLVSLVPILEPEEPWKRSLQALIQATSANNTKIPEQSTRIAWLVDYKKKKISINPREQKLGANGTWSKGRPVSLERLHNPGKLKFLTPQDRKICVSIQKVHNPDTNGINYHFDLNKALVAMIGHPSIFLSSSPTTPVEFVSGEPELLVEERGSNLHICFAQQITDKEVSIYRETPTRFKIIQINDNHRRIAQITGPNGLTVPLEASEQVLTAIGGISSFMTVHSAIAMDAEITQQNIQVVDADSTIYMHLLPYGSGFRLEMFVKPFPDGGHYLKPGQGVENIMAEVRGKRLQTKRDLALEEQKARDIEELCPIFDLAIDMEQENDREWHLQDPDDCLQALLELQAIRDKVIIEWPEGEKLSIAHQASLKNLNLKIRTNRQNWFAMTGELVIDQDKVIKLKDLLDKVKNSNGRFIEIAEGQFIALTQEFKKRLEDMNVFSDGFSEDEDELLIHPLAAMPLEKLTKQANTNADSGWREQLRKLENLEEYIPEVPSTLQAELRDYQREGFNWLARLSNWGVGGCLADDMGLGKTIQSLTIILKHAVDGPSLVVAPTSVSTNWQSEVMRFSPTLQLKSLSGKDRQEVIANLGPFDLLITTYTLLQQESEQLSKVKWQTVILDEAQAIKNAATKRSQAAMALDARFKLITTGTPIENHLGELWNLFHFINPGLLGTINKFNERYAIPIERYQDRTAKKKLKKLIRPFILRRIKSDVLDELPSKTEITLDVQMSPEEQHFYEALRQNALDILEKNSDKKGRHLQILTEIMRLRQACCNPRLIDPNTSISSGKLEIFSAVIEELLGGRHKALVFSQFIGHLQILREYLDERGISYQYLDGSTSSKQRKQRVDAFQAGEGDLFLISLKAGGLGLNLTAADYVLHMDPWWNPAIEDQASDRAHRLGQTRPVTIYRLVCKNTIEEKIVKLHQEKRDLAGSLLEGSDMSAKMSSEDLLDLLREA